MTSDSPSAWRRRASDRAQKAQLRDLNITDRSQLDRDGCRLHESPLATAQRPGTPAPTRLLGAFYTPRENSRLVTQKRTPV